MQLPKIIYFYGDLSFRPMLTKNKNQYLLSKTHKKNKRE